VDILDLQPYQVGPMERLGSRNDGGYVIPKWLPKRMTLISFGVGDNWSFERSCLKKKIITNAVMYDHTVGQRLFLSRVLLRVTTRKFDLKSLIYRILVVARYLRDFSNKNLVHVRKEITKNESSKEKINLLEVANDLGSERFILKVDIEGAEYEIVEQIVHLNEQIPLLLIEFHETEKHRHSFESSLKLLKENYILSHTHMNNYDGLSGDGIPKTLELTFCHRSYYSAAQKVTELPVAGLDQVSAPKRPDIFIKF
jgi:hypothetical protein